MESLGLTSAERAAFWNGTRVLVTGHTGFKGSWLSLWLQHLGAEVVGFALEPPTTPSLFDRARVADGMTSLHGDVRLLRAVVDAVETHRPEVVFHMAAQPLVRYSYDEPVETYATNVMGTVHVLEAIRQVDSVRAAVIVTTDKCYENREAFDVAYRETDAMGGFDPYSSSKGCAELVTTAYRRSFFTASGDGQPAASIASARAGNVIGGGDWADDRLVPDVVRAFEAGEAVEIRSPHAIRPWQHVLEPLNGYLTLAEQLWTRGATVAGAFNFGPKDEDAQPVGMLVQKMRARWGRGTEVVLDNGAHPHEAHFLRLDATKAHTDLGWQPRLDLDLTLAWTVAWYQDVADGADARSCTLSQIERYERLCDLELDADRTRLNGVSASPMTPSTISAR